MISFVSFFLRETSCAVFSQTLFLASQAFFLATLWGNACFASPTCDYTVIQIEEDEHRITPEKVEAAIRSIPDTAPVGFARELQTLLEGPFMLGGWKNIYPEGAPFTDTGWKKYIEAAYQKLQERTNSTAKYLELHIFWTWHQEEVLTQMTQAIH